jgi:hypothetical protein
MNKVTIVFLSLLIGVCCFATGLVIGNFGFLAEKNKQEVDKNTIELLKSISNGGEITITEQEFQKVTQEKEYNGKNETKDIKRDADNQGLTATEVAAMDQGINNSSIGQSKGYGILEKIWTTIRTYYWVIMAYFATYLAFSVAGTKIPILGTISKTMLSVITFGLGGIQWVFDHIKAKNLADENDKVSLALHQTVFGIDEAKKIEPKCKITLNSELEKAQDNKSKDIIRRIRNYQPIKK